MPGQSKDASLAPNSPTTPTAIKDMDFKDGQTDSGQTDSGQSK